jgi:hypothetical protein
MSKKRVENSAVTPVITAQDSGMADLFLMPFQAVISALPIIERPTRKRALWPGFCVSDRTEKRPAKPVRSAPSPINQQLIPKGEPS